MKANTSNTMRRIGIAILWLALCPVVSAGAQVSVGIGIGLPGLNIGINFPSYPQLVRVPGYPVYYAPHLKSNYFFYDGMYWVYQGDNWYASSWYNGPWGIVAPEVVPAYVLRVPVRYYRQPPVYFRGWRRDAAPRWANIGAVNGSSIAADGTAGATPRSRHRPLCPLTSDSIRVIAIPSWSNRARCRAETTVTSRATMSCASTIGSKARSDHRRPPGREGLRAPPRNIPSRPATGRSTKRGATRATGRVPTASSSAPVTIEPADQET